ncbi:hypothetical protein chiPu_0023099, partial [Chiloscyllium punctatum]|nr:hypothetical protein [Chiloscyllium punctatum]
SNLHKYYHRGFVCIRLALGGCTNRPFYRIVAAHNKRARDGKYLEQLGSYDPMPNIFNEKLVSFNFERIKYWLACGAHMTKPVEKLLGKRGSWVFNFLIISKALASFPHHPPILISEAGVSTSNTGRAHWYHFTS